MRKAYNKLVRDRIPEIIWAAGQECAVEMMDEEAFYQALRAKLVEEAQEAATATSEALVTELADPYEVIDALMTAYSIDRDVVLSEQRRRQRDRGVFSHRLRLLWSGAD